MLTRYLYHSLASLLLTEKVLELVDHIILFCGHNFIACNVDLYSWHVKIQNKIKYIHNGSIILVDCQNSARGILHHSVKNVVKQQGNILIWTRYSQPVSCIGLFLKASSKFYHMFVSD